MNKLSKKISSTSELINKLEQRISILESGFDLFTKRIQDESNSRLELAKSNQINYSANSFQIQALKEKIELISKSTNEALSQFQFNLTKDFSERTSHLQNVIMEKSTIFDTFDKKAQNTQELLFKLADIENYIKKIKEDIAQNTVKIEFLEKKQNDNYNTIKEQIMDINKNIMQFQNEFNIINKFKNNANENFAGMANDIFHQQETLEEFNNKIIEQMNNFELNSEKNNQKINEEINILKTWKDDIYKNIEIINEKTINEINKFIEDISNDINNNKNEISMMEKHITEEQNNFGNFIQEKMDNYENSINKNLTYCDEDIKLLRKDVDTLKINLNDFKEKTFDAVNDVEKFQNKKYDDLFRILSGNNLIKSNFRYNNNKLNNNPNEKLELSEKNNNNIVIQEQNYNIGLSRDN
jgi:predicted  nucleic acid-binding Zn-ribbon protein